MPSKNTVKLYVNNGYYHIYNRGVEKRKIFQDEQDYSVFLNYLKSYLTPKEEKELRNKLQDQSLSPLERDSILRELRLNNFYGEVNLLSYCLMPNHFHLLVKQKSANSLDRFMNSLSTRYVAYFNKKYKRVGHLYQDVYKAVLVESNPQLLYLTAYIHRNPLYLTPKLAKVASKGDPLQIQPSSYKEYIGLRKTDWINTEEILFYFSKTNSSLSYESFVKQKFNENLIKEVIIEKD